MRRQTVIIGSGFAAALVALGVVHAKLQAAVESQQQVQAPLFEVDPMWPKPLPNQWVLGNVIGVGVDARDHVIIVHRSDTVSPEEGGAAGTSPVSECCVAAPPVVEFDPEGNVVRAWGGPVNGAPYVWPGSNHGIAVDDKDNVWIGGNGPTDSHILKFTKDGKFVAQYGVPGQGGRGDSKSMERFGRVAKVSFDIAAQEAYVADGYLNRRVAVVDMNTGKIKRFWGAYGEAPHDNTLPAYNPDSALIRSFRTPVHFADPSNDGLIYVCDRPNNRIQVFRKDGTFVREVRVQPRTLGDGAVWDIAFSRDPQQRYLYLADGKNEKIHVFDRASMQILTEFGDGGRQPGQWFAVHSIATDSKGNIYTTETYEGKRLQKFTYKGVGSVPRVQGTLGIWPKK
jgi:DNA-binding beta-propeller fold protein YncE